MKGSINIMERGIYAPIILFVYNRADHTSRVIEALKKNREISQTDLYIYSDAAKTAADEGKVNEVRELISNISGFNRIEIIKRETNFGLAQNIISGVSEIVQKYGRCIVLEDDIVVSEYFLKYMNDSLDVYKEDVQVMAVSGFCEIGDKRRRKLPETFFLPWFDCWGWATWDRAWNYFKKNPEELAKTISYEAKRKININGKCNRWGQVEENLSGKISTWAIFFFIQIILNNGLILYPKKDMCQNIGNDCSGTDSGYTSLYSQNSISDRPISVERISIEENRKAVKEIEAFYELLPVRHFFERVIRKVTKCVHSVIGG